MAETKDVWLVLRKSDQTWFRLTVDNFGLSSDGLALPGLVAAAGHQVLLANASLDLAKQKLASSVLHGHSQLPEQSLSVKYEPNH